jgi:RNA polymerase sigma-70 factor (ECF subfamily)
MGPESAGAVELPRVSVPMGPPAPVPIPVAAGPLTAGPLASKRGATADARLQRLVGAQFDFVWRSLRRLGVPGDDVDDCAQQVFWVAARKLGDIHEGSERAFLFSTAMRVASDARRSRTRRREVHEEDAAEAADPAPDPEQVADRRRARAVLDEVLDAMPMDLRAPFVLFELEELPTTEIAALLHLPTGTVASRLRRAREEFQSIVARFKARDGFRGGER